MDHPLTPLLAWLEGEGQRRRRNLSLPPLVGDSPGRGWLQLGVCVLGGALAAGVLVCWLARSTIYHGRVRWAEARLSNWNPGSGAAITLAGARVEGVSRGVQTGRGPAPLVVLLRYRGLPLDCQFRGENIPADVRVGDTITIRASDRDEEQRERILLRNCELIEQFRLPGD